MDINHILERWDLSGADLSGKSLGGCNLAGKNLRGADLSYAHLGGANLRGADLRNANLYQANLGAADLTGADLRNADFRQTNRVGTIFIGADTRETIGFSNTPEALPSYLVKHFDLEETEEYLVAKQEGFLPLTHWGAHYQVTENGKPLRTSDSAWKTIKNQLGELIFGDKETYLEVRLVQKYKHYSQWAYMISQKGFEQMAKKLGLQISQKSEI